MKKRTGLDCIAHLGDVLFEETGGPTPNMADWKIPKPPAEVPEAKVIRPKRGTKRYPLLIQLPR